ncbi:hypothetical protein BGW41_001358 [Actinomortierella wolfii]|nr:hypothetical protein BGW41_001358 [Actinomortierella wolfii]
MLLARRVILRQRHRQLLDAIAGARALHRQTDNTLRIPSPIHVPKEYLRQHFTQRTHNTLQAARYSSSSLGRQRPVARISPRSTGRLSQRPLVNPRLRKQQESAAAATASAAQHQTGDVLRASSVAAPPPEVQGNVVQGLNAASTPAIVPEDPFGALQPFDAAATLLSQPALVMTRQIEMMNVLVGFEQANKYAIVDANGTPVGWVVEEDTSMVKAMGRQLMRTHRPFKAQVLDLQGNVLLKISRPFAFINSRIMIWTPDDRLIGEVQQEWHIYRRRYNLFTVEQPDPEEGRPDKIIGTVPGDENTVAIARSKGEARSLDRVQFAHIDGGFLALDFDMQDEKGRVMGSVNRNFVGFARELFTDSGQYVLRFDAAAMQELQQLQPGLGATPITPLPSSSSATSSAATPSSNAAPDASQVTGLNDPKEAALQIQANKDEVALAQLERRGGLTLDQRAVMLACAVSIDFDYFSRHSGSGGIMPMPIIMPMGGGAPPPVPSAGEGENPVGTVIGAGAGAGAGQVLGGAAGGAGGAGAADIPFGAGQAGMPSPPPPATDVWGNPVSSTNEWGEDVWAEDPTSTEDTASSWFGDDDDGDGGGDGGGFSWGDLLN